MSLTVCLAPANTVGYPQGGGHLWVYLNWALALRAAGCRVVWLEGVDDPAGKGERSLAHRRRWRGRDVRECVAALKAHLGRFGLADALALYSIDGVPLPADLAAAGLDLEAAADADLLLNLSHALPAAVVGRFRRSAFVDTDPGLFQVWMTTGDIRVAPHDHYFTIGETVGTPAARFPDCGLRWAYTPPPIYLPEWPVVRAAADAPYTTVAHWWGGTFEFNGITFCNEKRVSFLEYSELPRQTPVPAERAICLAEFFEEYRQLLEPKGWRYSSKNSAR